MNFHKTNGTLPFKKIENLKFLIDTGADNNFIDPKHTTNFKLHPTKTVVKTALKEHKINHKIIIDYLPQLNNHFPLEFLVFKFHHYFDGIIGNETLQKLKANIDYQSSSISFGTIKNKLHYKPFIKPQIFNLDPFEQTFIKLPTNIKNGDIYIPPVELNNHTQIISGIYTTNNFESKILVINESNSPQSFIISQPIRCELLNIIQN